MLKINFLVSLLLVSVLAMTLVPVTEVRGDTMNGHTVILDGGGSIVPWTTDPASGYEQVMGLAWNYLVNTVPNDSVNLKPLYFSHSCMYPDTQMPINWPHNPAGLYSMLIESALKYYAYSGDGAPVLLAQNIATALLDNGMTPAGWNWANVPYASGDSGLLSYHGAAVGDTTGIGDGTGVIEPDKLGEMGRAWLQLYRFSGNPRYRDAAIAAADALALHVRAGTATQSPWPFRVYAETGVIREEYSANVIGPISLFDDLISLGVGNVASYQSARQTAWSWLMLYPMQNNVWANYFEDMPIRTDLTNLNSYTAMMTARYLLEHPEYDASWESHVRGLIGWVETVFRVAAYGANTIAEQSQFSHPMGSHTSRYASVNALLSERTADAAAKEKAYRSLNWATYMARTNGVVIDGPEVNTQWFTDGYGDYIRHFMTSIGAVPEWSPPGRNHLLRSSSVVQSVAYAPLSISYRTSEPASTEVLRTVAMPAIVTADGAPLSQVADLSQQGWTFDPALKVLRIRHDAGTNIVVTLSLTSIAVTPSAPAISVGATLPFAATGTYSDGSTADLTTVASWSSSDNGVASVSSAGIATGVSPGGVTITAAFSGVSGTAALTVQAQPLTITTSSLPGGVVGVPYSTPLAAVGGTAPYSWSLAAGALPAGLGINTTSGVISGTPTGAGSFTFSVQVADSGIPVQTTTRSLSIAVGSQSTLWPTGTVPGIVDSGPDSAVELGVKFRADYSGYVTGIRFYKASTNTGTHVANLWNSGGTRLATATFTGETSTGWQQVNFTNPVAVAANTYYVASYHTNAGHYSDDQNYFAGRSVDAPPLHAPADGTSGFNGVYAYGSSSAFPSQGWRSSNYWVDVVFSAVPPADTTAPTVTAFTVPATSTSLTVPVTAFSATDNVAVTGYLVTESAAAPAPSAPGWTVTATTSFVFATQGSKPSTAGPKTLPETSRPAGAHRS